MASRRAADRSSLVIVTLPSPIMRLMPDAPKPPRPCPPRRPLRTSSASDDAVVCERCGRAKRLPHARGLALCRLRVQDGLLRLVIGSPPRRMDLIETHVNPTSDEFRANRTRMERLVAELRSHLANARQGGGPQYVERHRAAREVARP